MVDVTVSIVHASRPELTLGCLESLEHGAAERHAIEVVVLDNASGDDLSANLRERFPRSNVRVIEQPFRAGFGANHNTVARATASRYILILNPDTIIHDRALDKWVESADRHPEAGAFGCRVLNPDGSYQDPARPFPLLRVSAPDR